jgi:hypothetical protein
LLGHKFRRQVPIGPYFADFACLEARLVVELDGDHHSEQSLYDARRDQWLSEMGFRVLRFWVTEVDENLDGLIATISDALGSPVSRAAPHCNPLGVPVLTGSDPAPHKPLVGALGRTCPPGKRTGAGPGPPLALPKLVRLPA